MAKRGFKRIGKKNLCAIPQVTTEGFWDDVEYFCSLSQPAMNAVSPSPPESPRKTNPKVVSPGTLKIPINPFSTSPRPLVRSSPDNTRVNSKDAIFINKANSWFDQNEQIDEEDDDDYYVPPIKTVPRAKLNFEAFAFPRRLN